MPDEAPQLRPTLRAEDLALLSVEVHPLQLVLDEDLAGLLGRKLLLHCVMLSDVLVQKEQLAARSTAVGLRHCGVKIILMQNLSFTKGSCTICLFLPPS